MIGGVCAPYTPDIRVGCGLCCEHVHIICMFVIFMALAETNGYSVITITPLSVQQTSSASCVYMDVWVLMKYLLFYKTWCGTLFGTVHI